MPQMFSTKNNNEIDGTPCHNINNKSCKSYNKHFLWAHFCKWRCLTCFGVMMYFSMCVLNAFGLNHAPLFLSLGVCVCVHRIRCRSKKLNRHVYNWNDLEHTVKSDKERCFDCWLEVKTWRCCRRRRRW